MVAFVRWPFRFTQARVVRSAFFFFFWFFLSSSFFSFVLRLHKFIADSCLSRSHKLSLLIITSFVGSFLYVRFNETGREDLTEFTIRRCNPTIMLLWIIIMR